MVVRALHREIADTVRETLTDVELTDPSRESIAMFCRKAADLLKADCPAFSYEWFFGACGLDSWGELLPDQTIGNHRS